MTLHIIIWSNIVIGLCFLVVPCCAIWLYLHRHKDWPKAWVILLIGLCMGSSAIGRIIHGLTWYYWPKLPPEVMAMADLVTSVFAFSACLLPWAVYEIRKIPSLAEYEHQWRGNQQKKRMEEEAQRLLKEKEMIERRNRILIGVLKETVLPEYLKQEVEKLTQEVPL